MWWYSRDSVSKRVSRYYSTDVYTMPIIYTFQLFPIEITELISAYLQRKVNVIHPPVTMFVI